MVSIEDIHAIFQRWHWGKINRACNRSNAVVSAEGEIHNAWESLGKMALIAEIWKTVGGAGYSHSVWTCSVWDSMRHLRGDIKWQQSV